MLLKTREIEQFKKNKPIIVAIYLVLRRQTYFLVFKVAMVHSARSIKYENQL